MLLAACVRAGRPVQFEASGPRLAQSLCATACDNEFALVTPGALRVASGRCRSLRRGLARLGRASTQLVF